jgi:hypothetical protein
MRAIAKRTRVARTVRRAAPVTTSKTHHLITQLRSLQCTLDIVDPVPEDGVLAAEIFSGHSLVMKLLGYGEDLGVFE